MKSNYINIKPFHSILLIVITLLMNVTLSLGQNPVKTTKITDGSIGSGINQPAVDFAILELESNTKGFLLPRMTTSERDALTAKITDKDRGNGLAIYNITDDCINYWSKTAGAKKPDGSFEGKWLSVCGALPPATVEMNNCKATLNASGQKELTQGRSLRDTDILYVSVKVIHSGSYTISAVSSNGYSFSKSGVFETPGVYSIALEGFGTPMEASSGEGDLVSFTLNGKADPNCSGTNVKVKSSEIDYEVLSAASFNWNAYKGIALSGDDNKIELSVRVTTAGFWRIQSEKTDNGISLSGSGEFDDTHVGTTQKIYVYGQGTPQKAGVSNFKFVTNSKNNKAPNVTVNITTLEASFELACSEMSSQFVARGDYQEGMTLSRGNSVTIPVKVINPGPIDIELIGSFTGGNSSQEAKFKATGIFLGKKGDIQEITLSADRIQIPLNTTAITFTSMKPESVTMCSTMPTVPVRERSKVYSVNCGKVSATGTYKIGQPLVGTKDGILVSVDVGYADKYHIKTNTVNGVSFEGSGTFTDQDRADGTVRIRLQGTGTPVDNGVHHFEVTSLAADGSVYHVCEARVNFVGPTINVLAVGTIAYAPTDDAKRYAPNAIIQNTNLFGPNGKVSIENIRIFKNSPVYRMPDNLASYLKSNDIDIVIIGYPTRFSESDFMALRDFIKNDKGAVILADELNLNRAGTGTANMLVNALQLGSTNVQSTNGSEAFTMVNIAKSDASNDPIIKSTEFGSVKYTGNDAAGNGWYFSNLSKKDYKPLIVSSKDENWISCFRHNEYGFVFIGDGGAFSGSEGGHPDLTIWPAAYDNSGRLFSKPFLYSGSKYEVSNSILYANMLKWAIEYVLEHKK
ncbi:hypothetical protein [Myroides odoratimimus]|uniref:hypothetical protein n=1 Tax=Myroides odoratimimus TaxID=76832 RepID=UPI0031018FD8